MAVTSALATTVLAVAAAIARFPDGLSVLVCLVLAVGAAWYGVCRRGAARVLGAAAAALLIVAAIVLEIAEHRLLEDLLAAGKVLATLGAIRMAFSVTVHWPRVAAPAHPVMIYNPLASDAQAVRLGLAEEAHRPGIEPVKLREGEDLEALTRRAVDRGADALAMAGGDGSQAVVAMIAAELGLPYACIPAGTRNHFGLDLGVDRSDAAGALDTFLDGGERRVNLAQVNGRVFVNNVSLGLYANAVRQPEYRPAKLQTLLGTAPETLRPTTDKRTTVTWAGGSKQHAPVAIVVSNNAYRLGPVLGSGTRRG